MRLKCGRVADFRSRIQLLNFTTDVGSIFPIKTNQNIRNGVRSFRENAAPWKTQTKMSFHSHFFCRFFPQPRCTLGVQFCICFFNQKSTNVNKESLHFREQKDNQNAVMNLKRLWDTQKTAWEKRGAKLGSIETMPICRQRLCCCGCVDSVYLRGLRRRLVELNERVLSVLSFVFESVFSQKQVIVALASQQENLEPKWVQLCREWYTLCTFFVHTFEQYQ